MTGLAKIRLSTWLNMNIHQTSSSIVELPCWLKGKESACNAGDLHSIPGSGKSPGEGNGYPLQYSCPEDSKNRRTWQAIVHAVTKELDVTERLTLSLSS